MESVDAGSGEASGSPTAFRPPLYPWLISWLADAQGNIPNQRIAILHWLLGVATSIGTYCVAKKMFSHDVRSHATNETAALFAGCLVAVDPLLLRASSLVMTETLAAFLVVVTYWFWVRLNESLHRKGNPSPWLALACLTGSVCGFAYLCRPTFVLWPLAMGGYIIVQGVVNRRAGEVNAGGIIIAILAVFVGVWMIRNDRVFDKPIWATTHGGYTLLLGNNDVFFDEVVRQPWGTTWQGESLDAWQADLERRTPAFAFAGDADRAAGARCSL
ncbi:MAG: glycosyltransferase family 39 protein [Caldilineaceae bacterium]|nr:glycosyltransferase family 39 protein [Caldilineaceae bacterium]